MNITQCLAFQLHHSEWSGAVHEVLKPKRVEQDYADLGAWETIRRTPDAVWVCHTYRLT